MKELEKLPRADAVQNRSGEDRTITLASGEVVVVAAGGWVVMVPSVGPATPVIPYHSSWKSPKT